MATFTPLNANSAIDTRVLTPWLLGYTIDAISFTPSTTVELRDFDPSPPSTADLILTYVSSATMGATGLTPTSGTFTSVTYLFEGTTTGGTLSGISPAALFSATVTNDAYHIFDGNDTINGTSQADTLFAGYAGNDTLIGNGGGDAFLVYGRGATAPQLTITGTPGATDTLFIDKNLYTNDNYLDLRASTLSSINAVSLGSGVAVTVNSTQIGPGISASAVIGAFAGTAIFDVECIGTFDAASLSIHPNTTLRLFGATAGPETMSGTENADVFYPGGGDVANGRGGNDVFFLTSDESGSATINGGAGTDTVSTTAGPNGGVKLNGFDASASSIEAWSGSAYGTDSANTLDFRGLTSVQGTQGVGVKGVGGADSLYGSGFDDSLGGGDGNDLLSGENGADLMAGDAGKDTMTGGAAGDTFWYWATTDSQRSKALRDVITDFQAGADKIYLSVIDPDSGKAGDQKFKFTKKEGAASRARSARSSSTRSTRMARRRT